MSNFLTEIDKRKRKQQQGVGALVVRPFARVAQNDFLFLLEAVLQTGSTLAGHNNISIVWPIAQPRIMLITYGQ